MEATLAPTEIRAWYVAELKGKKFDSIRFHFKLELVLEYKYHVHCLFF